MLRYLVFFIAFCFSLFASTDITIDEKDKYDDFKISYIIDENSHLTIDEIAQKTFEKTTSNKFTLGYNKGTVWFKFTLTNSSNKENFIFTLNEHFYEKANLYYHEDEWIQKSNGLFIPIEKREIKNNKLSFSVKLPKNSTQTYYLEVQGKYAYFGNISLYEKEYFYFDKQLDTNLLFIFLFGILIIIIIFNILLYIKLKEKIYIYYVGYSFFNLIFLINISGLLAYINLQYYIYDLQISAAFMIAFLILFSKEYLETKKYLRVIDKFLNVIAIIFFIIGFLVVYSYQPWNKVINNFSGIVNILLIAVAVIIYFKGNKKTKFYLFAISTFFIFVILFTFMVLGIFEYNFFTRYGIIISTTFEASVFALILANRYNDRKENIQSYLEFEVEDRTKSLTTVNNKLTTLIGERELLLREVYHRVKNNFHIVIGMLWLESKKEGSKNSQRINEVINRIKSMSLIHEELYKSEDLTNINLQKYLEKIVHNIFVGYPNIALHVDVQKITIEFDNALSLGIIVNEIFTNSVKHNSNMQDFSVKIELIKIDNTIALVIQDNGLGFEKSSKNKGVGLDLIKQFCKKLPNSKSEFSFENGTRFELKYEYK